MPLTASFTEYRKDLTAITDLVMTKRVPVTVFKNSKPAFKIVPIEPLGDIADAQGTYLDLAAEIDAEYHDVFEALAK